ncbi:hypothetical protein CDAR_564101 [Caerostris darwini]|uniref:Uncharacterized protein n=1 Tax=Caerostris darwini TaxID=1538125 RepID=A0AAV4M708_9ARAC|nr:hypothetical protein CDAR_564101 [Caerostris darwini]
MTLKYVGGSQTAGSRRVPDDFKWRWEHEATAMTHGCQIQGRQLVEEGVLRCAIETWNKDPQERYVHHIIVGGMISVADLALLAKPELLLPKER